MTWQVGLYVAAVLIPLAAFVVELLVGRMLGKLNAYLATAAIATSFVLSLIGFVQYFGVEAEGVFSGHHAEVKADANPPAEGQAPGHGPTTTGTEHAEAHDPGHARREPIAWSAGFDWVTLGAPTLGAPSGKAAPTGLTIPIGVRIDNLAAIMFLMVTFIATLVHVYSMGYMADDPQFPRFFTYMSLFCFSMLGLIASSNIFMVFVFWELVGVCSYLLIGFWYEDKKNADAANKAFIANRVGDVGMLLGLGLIWTSLGTFDIHEINSSLRDGEGRLNAVQVEGGGEVVQLRDRATGEPKVDPVTGNPRQIAFWALGLAGLGVFAGCVGKSAQFPLHVWLPDAMAGPTPVSALVHSATMVAAGVYLVGRFFPLFTEGVLLYIAYTGGITLFVAATIAMVQTDYKKVLAYSTISQLGFMMLGLGVGGWAAGLFHLITHACFKALLFLGAGSVYHSVHTYDMNALGGLRKKMPITAYTMLAATLAISGVPFFSGFYSKDAILASALFKVTNHPEHIGLFILPVVGAAITAFYMFRMWFLIFSGTPRGFPAVAHGDGHDAHHHHQNPVEHAHESGPLMAWPLLALAVPTIMIGWPQFLLPISEPILEMMLAYGEPIKANDLGSAHYYALMASVLIGTVGIGLGVLFYGPFDRWRILDPRKAAERFGGVYRFLVHKWYFDELYQATLIGPTLALARLTSRFDRSAVDGLVNGTAGLTVLASRVEGLFDRYAVDGLVNLTGKAVYVAGDWGRAIQTGKLRNYLMFLAGAMVLLLAFVFAWVGN